MLWGILWRIRFTMNLPFVCGEDYWWITFLPSGLWGGLVVDYSFAFWAVGWINRGLDIWKNVLGKIKGGFHKLNHAIGMD